MKPHHLSDSIKQIIAAACHCKISWNACDETRIERGPVTRQEANLILAETAKLLASATPLRVLPADRHGASGLPSAEDLDAVEAERQIKEAGKPAGTQHEICPI